jgi:hypothetical protein
MNHLYLKSLIRLLILVMALVPLQSVTASVINGGAATMPCSMMGSASMSSMTQDGMEMDRPCQMVMDYAHTCVNCDYGTVAVLQLPACATTPIIHSHPVSSLFEQVTSNTAPPLFRPPITASII